MGAGGRGFESRHPDEFVQVRSMSVFREVYWKQEATLVARVSQFCHSSCSGHGRVDELIVGLRAGRTCKIFGMVQGAA